MPNPLPSASVREAASIPEAGVFGPDSMIWRIAGERITLLGGSAATILQVAHPKVGQGVEEHSHFRTDMVGRLNRTLAAIYAIAYGNREEVLAMQSLIARIHGRVRGTTPEGAAYSAFEPDLQLWVVATLVMTASRLYEIFIAPLSSEEKQRYLDDMRIWGEFFGLERSYGPQRWEEFESYYWQMIKGPVLGSSPVCSSVAHGIAYPEEPFWLKAATRPFVYLSVELVPEPLRSRLGLRSTLWTRLGWRITSRLGRLVYRHLPAALRLAPMARRAWAGTPQGAPPK